VCLTIQEGILRPWHATTMERTRSIDRDYLSNFHRGFRINTRVFMSIEKFNVETLRTAAKMIDAFAEIKIIIAN